MFAAASPHLLLKGPLAAWGGKSFRAVRYSAGHFSEHISSFGRAILDCRRLQHAQHDGAVLQTPSAVGSMALLLALHQVGNEPPMLTLTYKRNSKLKIPKQCAFSCQQHARRCIMTGP